jgi:hypothetical protein
MEHEEQAERMEKEAERMEEHSEQLGERIDDIESDWERKEQDPAVPGARPDPDEVVPEDDPGSDEGETPSPGVPGEDETSTGNPDNAGAEK